jgi:hypothetical protein
VIAGYDDAERCEQVKEHRAADDCKTDQCSKRAQLAELGDKREQKND